jgi:hypothetical protein
VTDRQVAATLRQAIRQGLIVSWIHLPNGDWTIQPQIGGAQNRDSHQVRSYCRMLNHAGISPCTGLQPEPSAPSPSTDTTSSTSS